MAEYIEREKALKALPAGQGCGVICYRAINRIPTADVAPVRHGRWIANYEYEDFIDADCSVCGKRSDFMYKYCPFCGARMDLGGADNA